MAMTVSDGTFEELAEGIHEAMFSGYEESSGEFGPSVKLVWSLYEDGKPTDNEKWQFCSQKLTPRATLYNVAKAMGWAPVVGESMELAELLDPLVGTVVNLVVKHEDTPKGVRAKVTDVLPIKGKK